MSTCVFEICFMPFLDAVDPVWNRMPLQHQSKKDLLHFDIRVDGRTVATVDIRVDGRTGGGQAGGTVALAVSIEEKEGQYAALGRAGRMLAVGMEQTLIHLRVA